VPPAVQQPLGQELASHPHCPVVLLHFWPVEHGEHAAPPVPHDRSDSDEYGSHVPVGPPLQQPLGQVLASHTHWPLPLQSRPGAHAAHAAPFAPQEVADSAVGTSHVLPGVQQPGHDVPPHEHDPFVHGSPFTHAAHAPPPVPHWADVCEENGTHPPVALQQPLGQDVGLHRHCPLLVSHATPAAHAAQAAPPMPHSFDDCEACETHWPFAVQHPSAQVLGPHAAGASGASSLV